MKPALSIPRISVDYDTNALVVRKVLLTKGMQGTVESQAWDAYKVDSVSVTFSIGFYDKTVCILFQVTEDEIRATYTNHLDPVYKDSCVEFFMADEVGRYVNIECNPYGAVLAGIGYSRNDRVLLDKGFFSQLRVWTSLSPSEPPKDHNWEVLLQIPLEDTGMLGPEDDVVTGTFTGNIYKCGDDLQQPHYISWAPIQTPSPDFHQSSFFGTFTFVD